MIKILNAFMRKKIVQHELIFIIFKYAIILARVNAQVSFHKLHCKTLFIGWICIYIFKVLRTCLFFTTIIKSLLLLNKIEVQNAKYIQWIQFKTFENDNVKNNGKRNVRYVGLDVKNDSLALLSSVFFQGKQEPNAI